MSIQTELTRITNAKAAIKTAIEGKGITVPDATLLDGMAALIDSIEAGGGNLWGGKYTTGSFVLAEETTSKYVIATNTDEAMLGLLNEGEIFADAYKSIGLLVIRKPTTTLNSSDYANCLVSSIVYATYFGSSSGQNTMTSYFDKYGTARAITNQRVGAIVSYNMLSVAFTTDYVGSPDFTYQWIAWRGVI